MLEFRFLLAKQFLKPYSLSQALLLATLQPAPFYHLPTSHCLLERQLLHHCVFLMSVLQAPSDLPFLFLLKPALLPLPLLLYFQKARFYHLRFLLLHPFDHLPSLPQPGPLLHWQTKILHDCKRHLTS